nr:gastrula zinc finger protein XlCGF8.2DB-like [Nerophis lumbriciformis]
MESRRADVDEEDISPEQQQQEPQPLYGQEEDEEQLEGLKKFPVIRMRKSKDGKSKDWWSQLDDSSEKRSEACGLLDPPLSDSDDMTSQFPDTDDEDFKADIMCFTDNTHFKCSQCDKTFGNRKNLNAHRRTHTGNKPFSCTVCGKGFPRKAHLMAHTRLHTGEKPFSCSVCRQRFSQKAHLKAHMRTHTGEKPFCCSVCGKTFAQKGHLLQHTRTHTGEKPFSCNVCDDRFTYKYQLNKHACAGDCSRKTFFK